MKQNPELSALIDINTNIMEKGKVKWYNEDKGFGFIEIENSADVFVHRTGIANKFGQLKEGDEVTFETEQGPKGPTAVNVKTID